MRLNQYSPHDLSTQGAKIDPVVTKKSSIFQNKNHFFDRQKRINWIVPPQPVIDREQVRVYPRQNITQCGKPTSIWPYGHIRSLLSKNMMKTSICRHQKIVSSGLPKSLSNFMPINKPPLHPPRVRGHSHSADSVAFSPPRRRAQELAEAFGRNRRARHRRASRQRPASFAQCCPGCCPTTISRNVRVRKTIITH